MKYSQIKKFYFTACGIILLLLFVLMLIRNGWTITPKAVLSTLVGWIVICAVIIGVIYMLVAKKKVPGEQNKPEENEDQASLPE